MSLANAITTDTLPSNVPKLELKGTNWAIFAFRFQTAVAAKELWKQFDGKTPCPTPADMKAGATTAEAAAIEQWRKNENLAKNLLTQRIPDSTALRVKSLPTVAAMWKEITREFTEKGAYAQTELRAQFLESSCPSGGDIRQFLEGLRTKREELASVGITITEQDYRSTIIKSLPNSLANFASSQLASAKLLSTSKTIEPDILISVISEEWERQKAKNPRCQVKTEDHDDEAMFVAGAAKNFNRGNKGQRGSNWPPRACWNCGSTEHLNHKCPGPQAIKV